MKRKKAFIEIYDDDGNIIKKIPIAGADDDWIRAGRLRKQAQEGDMEAAERLRKMENFRMYFLDTRK